MPSKEDKVDTVLATEGGILTTYGMHRIFEVYKIS